MNIFLVNSLNCSVSLLFNELNPLFNTPYSSLKEFKEVLLNHDLEYIDHKVYYTHKLALQGQAKNKKLCYTAEEFIKEIKYSQLSRQNSINTIRDYWLKDNLQVYLRKAIVYDIDKLYLAINDLFPLPYQSKEDFIIALEDWDLDYFEGKVYRSFADNFKFKGEQNSIHVYYSIDKFIERVSEERLTLLL